VSLPRRSRVAEVDPFAGLVMLGAVPGPGRPAPTVAQRRAEVVFAAAKPPRLTLQAVQKLLEHQSPRARAGQPRQRRDDRPLRLSSATGRNGTECSKWGHGAGDAPRCAGAAAGHRGGSWAVDLAGALLTRRAPTRRRVAREMGLLPGGARADDVGVAGCTWTGRARCARCVRGRRRRGHVAAGMDGALPSVVAGLVDAGWIGGPQRLLAMAWRGVWRVAALLGMPVTRAPGLVGGQHRQRCRRQLPPPRCSPIASRRQQRAAIAEFSPS
jgi:hypothetical protein